MRFLVLVTDAFGGTGGIAKFNRDLLTALCSYPDCAEVVAIPRLMPHPPESFPEKLTYVTDGLNSKLKFTFTVLKTVLRNPKFDLILCGHIHLLPAAYLISRLLRFARNDVIARIRQRSLAETKQCQAPLLLIIHGIEAWRPSKNYLADRLVRRIDGFISVSKFTKEKFLSWSSVNRTANFILPNCVDLDRFCPGPKNETLLTRYGLKGKTVLMTCGRLESRERYKGFDEVLELLPELSQEISNVVYLIVGDGDDRKRLKEKAGSLGIADRVIFAGYISESEKADHYRLADAYVMPSTGEGFGIVLLEAMACGIPAIGSKLDGSREALRYGELGMLVDPTDRAELKAAIPRTLKLPKRLPAKLDHFSFEKFRERLHQITTQLSCE